MLPDAVRFTNTIAGGLWSERSALAGFYVPGLEETTGRGSCEVDVGDVCRPRAANRQDQDLSRLNRARAQHGNFVPYCKEKPYRSCEPPGLRTTPYGDEPYEAENFCDRTIGEGPFAGQRQRKAMVTEIFRRAKLRRRAVSGRGVGDSNLNISDPISFSRRASTGVSFTPIAGRRRLIQF